MRIANPWKCDYCGAIKGEQNHWWMRDLVSAHLSDSFCLVRWDEDRAGEEQSHGKPEFEHICGRVCAGKALEKWLAGAVSVDS